MTLRTVTLLTARALSHDVRSLTFDAGEGFAYTPGQWVSLKLPRADGSTLARSYSIASAPRADGRFEIAVTRVEGGEGSTWLHAVEPGATLAMSEPAGFFTLPEVLERPLLLVATGTGVAPIRAMIQHLDAQGSTVPLTLLFGVRTPGDVIFEDEFRELAARRANVRFEPTLSRAPDGYTGRTGYVQTHLAALVHDLGGDCEVYVCGLNAMIREVRRTLKEELGFTRERIHTERYD